MVLLPVAASSTETAVPDSKVVPPEGSLAREV
jgi:hypothetical protein